MANKRYHFLDGLRGVAMLLGLVLHAAISFVGFEAWPAVDVKSDPDLFNPILDAIHGFRMPLFFLVSGFFTAMMFRKRGLRGLVKQRRLRIGVPLVAGVLIVAPLMGILGEWGGEVKAERREVGAASQGEVWQALLGGDAVELQQILEGGGDVEEKDERGTPALHLASIMDRGDLIEILVDNGADLDSRGADGGTALMSAAFFGRVSAAEILLARGADVASTNHQGNDAMGAATMDFKIIEMVGKSIGVEVNEETQAGREAIAELLQSEGEEKNDDSLDWYWMGVFMPVFHHLWFLYYLMWLLLFFVPLAWLVRKTGWRLPDVLVVSPWCLFWVIPLTWWAQTGMEGTFGPGTATGIFPWGVKLGYYAIFFFFGALCFGRGLWEEKVGNYWWMWILAAVPFLVVGRSWTHGELATQGQGLAAVYCWLMIIGLMGLFRRFLNDGRRWVRYLSDASYWLYLAHMPLMIVVQILISGWDAPVFLKFGIVLIAPTALLLVIYEYAVRYTWIGVFLNGRKFRNGPPPLPELKE